MAKRLWDLTAINLVSASGSEALAGGRLGQEFFYLYSVKLLKYQMNQEYFAKPTLNPVFLNGIGLD